MKGFIVFILMAILIEAKIFKSERLRIDEDGLQIDFEESTNVEFFGLNSRTLQNKGLKSNNNNHLKNSATVEIQEKEDDALELYTTLGMSSYTWRQEVKDMEFHSVSAAPPYLLAGAGTSSWSAMYECVNLEGYGTPVWTIPVPNAYAVTSQKGYTALVTHQDDYSTISLLRLPSSEPIWSHTIHDPSLPVHRHTVDISLNGETVTAVFTMVDESGQYWARLYWFDSYGNNSFVELNYGTMVRDTAITNDGQFFAALVKEGLFVFDTRNSELIDSWFPSDGSAGEVCMSGDGQYIAFGFQKFFIYSWNDYERKYLQLDAINHNAYYVSSCVFSNDGSTLVISSYRADFKANRVEVRRVNKRATSSVYIRDFQEEVESDYQDFPSDLAMTPDGKFFALSSWGNAARTTPTISIFNTHNSTAIYQIVTPGSMKSISLSESYDNLYVVAGGKHTHANDYGDSGDLYMIKLHFTSNQDGIVKDVVLERLTK